MNSLRCNYRVGCRMARWSMNEEQLLEWELAGETAIFAANPLQCNFVHLIWDRTRAAVVGSQGPISWAVARSGMLFLGYKCITEHSVSNTWQEVCRPTAGNGNILAQTRTLCSIIIITIIILIIITIRVHYNYANSLNPVWSWPSPIGCLPRWRIGKFSSPIWVQGTEEIKYSGRPKPPLLPRSCSVNYRG
jgi:hypothetical protein